MTIYPATLSRYPVVAGTVLTVDGSPKCRDMLRLSHANNTHTAAFVEKIAEDYLVLAIDGDQCCFRREDRPDGGKSWTAE